MILWECLRDKPESTFTEYNSRRLADSHALYEYANYANEIPWFSGERVSREVSEIFYRIFIRNSIDTELFGPLGVERKPYSQIVNRWRFHQNWITNFVRFFIYPIVLIFELLLFPITITKFLVKKACETKDYNDYSIKPTVGEIDLIKI